VPLENRIRLLPVPLRSSGGSGVFVDEAAQDGFSVDPLRIEAGGGGAGLLVRSVRDALVDALVRPGAVVVRLVPGQDRIDARGAQDLVDGRRRDRRAELGQLAVDPPVSPERVLFCQADGEAGDAPEGRGRPGLRRLLVSYFLAASLRCQASSVAGVTGKIPAQRRRGMNRASAVNHARSAGSYRGRPTWRRSTAFSWRSTRSSASFASSPRNTRTVTLNNQRIST
jgi:hypothetical protein